MHIEIDLNTEADDWSDVSHLLEDTITQAASIALPKDITDFTVSITLTNNSNIQILNNKFRNKNKPTNVLSFPQFEPDEITALPELHLGDLVFALETIQKEAMAENKTFENHLRHLTVHGFLHLLGYDHIEDEQAEEMEALEVEILAGMGVKNPYQD